MSLALFILLLAILPFMVTLSHWLGDYILQAPFGDMAIKKKTDSRVALAHCCIYTACHIPMLLLYVGSNPLLIFIGAALIFILHFMQDRYEWPLKFYMDKARTAGTWEPVLYIAFDNGYHWLTNYAIIIFLCLFRILLV